MSITISDIFIPKGSWRVSRGFDAHGKYGIPGIDYAMANDSLLVNCFYTDAIVDKIGTNPKGKDWGEYIWLKSLKDPRYKAAYAHCRRFVVKKGQKIKSGQLIGYSDNSGNSTGPHLHFSVTFNGKAIDPAKLPWKVRNIKKPYTPPKPKIVEPWYKKDIKAKAAEIVNLKKAITSLKKQIREDYVTKVSFEKALKKSQLACDQVSKQRLDNHNATTDTLKGEIDTLKIKVQSLKDEITTFKEPKGVEIPRVTKFDNLGSKIWKRTLQYIGGKKLPDIKNRLVKSYRKIIQRILFVFDAIRGKV